MSVRTAPPFRADHVGSLLRTAALKEARAQREGGEITGDELKAVEDREIEQIIRRQEEIGLKAVTDGEFRRAFWNYDFLSALPGVEAYLGERKIKFQGTNPKPMMLRVIGKLDRFTTHPMLEHFVFLKAHTRVVPKMSIPSPSSLHFRYGRDAVPENIYPDMNDFYRDLGQTYRQAVHAFADAGCRYLQLDEVNFTYLCDPKLRAQVANRGDDPEKLPAIYAGMINAAITDIPPDMTITMHLCRGNFQSTFVASGARAGSGNAVQCDQRARLLHGIRHRARWWLRAAAPGAEGQDRCARPGHFEKRTAGGEGRHPAPHQAGGEIHSTRAALPVAAMRLRLDRGRQYPGRGRAVDEAQDDRGSGTGSVGLR